MQVLLSRTGGAACAGPRTRQSSGTAAAAIRRERLRNMLREQLDAPLREQLDAPLREQLDAPLREQLDAPLREQLDAPLREQLDADEQSVTEIGLELRVEDLLRRALHVVID